MKLSSGSTITFFRNLRRRPRNTGAILPSGPVLAKTMAAAINPAIDGPILELGPGTGVFTKALLERGIAPERLILIEFNADFVRFLKARFPGVTIIHASAFDLPKLWKERNLPPIAGIVSGLPLLNFPKELGQQLIADSLNLLQPGGQYVQFTYAQRPSVPAPAGVQVNLLKRVWLNVPPASVWIYQKKADSQSAAA